MNKNRRIFFEILLLLLIALVLSLLYNAVSSTGLRILPRSTQEKALSSHSSPSITQGEA